MPSDGSIRFGVFEVDLGARELRKRGVRMKLQDQPFRVLEALLEKPGEIVTREELKERLWAHDEFVEFDKSLNTAVQKIRQALDDSASAPRYLETLPRRGYRFVAPVEAVRSPPAAPRRQSFLWIAAATGGAALVLAASVAIFRSETSQPLPRLRSRPLTFDSGSEGRPSFSPDGTRVAYQADQGDPARSDIYITLTDPAAGAPIRVTNTPAKEIEPAWSPDGSQLVFARILEAREAHIGSSFKLILASPTENASERELTAETFTSRNPNGILPAWSRDGKHIVFGCRIEASTPQMQICIFSMESREVRALTFPANFGVGHVGPALSPDGRTLVYLSAGLFLQRLSADMRPEGKPWALSGTAALWHPQWSNDGESLYAMGAAQGEEGLWKVGLSPPDEPRRLWPNFGFFPALWQGPAGTLKLAYEERVYDAEIVLIDLHGESSKRTVLAPSNAADYHPQFSPDGSKIAFMSNRSGTNGVWICDRDGSNVRSLIDIGLTSFFSVPMWSPDGKRIATDGFFGSRNTHIIELGTKQAGPALTRQGGRMPTWSKDGGSLYYYSDIGGARALWRLDLDTQASTKLLERPGIFDICETPDGSALYFLQGEDLMRGKLDGGVFAGEPVRVESNVVAFALVPGAVYVRTREGAIMRRDAVGGSARLVLQTDGSFGPANLGFTVSKDERWLVYSRWGRWEMDLKLLEGNE